MLATLPATASAQTGVQDTITADDCPDNYFCLYDGAEYNNRLVYIHKNQGQYKLPDWARDRASSFKNYTDNCIEIRDYASPFNHYTHIFVGEDASELRNKEHPDGTWNNRVDELHTDDC